MTRSLVAFALLVASRFACADVSVVDDNGATLRLAQPARRIVTLAPHLAETVFAAGAGDKLVGTVEFSDFPEAVKTLPKVGGYSRLDLEAIAALKPDLIIGWSSGNAPEKKKPASGAIWLKVSTRCCTCGAICIR